MKKALFRWLLLSAAVIVVLTGCSDGKPPKEALQNAVGKTADMKSYTFKGALAIDELSLPPDLLEGNAAMLDMVKNASVTVDGAYQADPMQMEMNMSIALKGDLAFNLNVPIVLTEKKVWIKVPNIPGYDLGEAKGKFLEIDVEELQQEQGIDASATDVDTQRKLMEDVTGIVLKHFDGKDYFSEPKAADVPGLPEELKPDQIVKFGVTPDNFDATVETLVKKVAPEVIDLLLNNEKYRKALQLQETDLNKAKENLAKEEEVDKQVAAFKESVKVNELSIIGAIKKEFLVYQVVKANVDVTDNGQTSKVGMTVNTQYDNINEKVEFKTGIPTETIKLEELMGAVMGTGEVPSL